MSSEKLLPSGKQMRESLEEAKKLGELPQPKGWKILVMMPDYETVTTGGIVLPSDYVDREEVAAPVALVVAKGNLAYTDPKRFVDGLHWCQEGDFIIVRAYSGTRLDIHGKEFRLINDDTVEAVIADPRVIKRV